ncbi:MAG: methylmalonyl-CoA mutase [Flavobacteriaceae bacterium]|nr:methylmalonyl-CoA mutase subunit beta [Bacteroidia bacterium]NNF81588.1 methylmalonyl-CoA mutase [Flavobacteriaceae bacterium]NNL81453.1 methylmalonyl-CoA mutase [Flavobacteriaceae bacterium]
MFDSVSSKEWKNKIQYDLKGADYNDSVVWSSHEGIDVKPFYHSDDIFITRNLTADNSYQISQQIYAAKLKKTLKRIRQAFDGGANHIHLIISEEQHGNTSEFIKVINSLDASALIEFEKIPNDSAETVFGNSLSEQIHVGIDIIGHLAQSGNWYYSLEADHDVLGTYIKKATEKDSVISIGIDIYQNAGANSIQQLAYALAHVNEYLNHYQSEWNLIPTFKLAIGSNYFFEIAKIRAVRLLWQTLADEYGVNPECRIFATPSKRNKTIYDYNNNMIRTTMECMSGILGGADVICNFPYDGLYHKYNEFGSRISRNQPLILKHESYFDRVSNPAEGSYYIESLTSSMANGALELFKEIERQGGMVKQLFSGNIQRKIRESGDKEQELFNASELVLIGTNRYPNTKDKMEDELQLFPFVKTKKRKTLIEPIIGKRLAEAYEKERLENE